MYNYGIDVSYANGEVDWESIKDEIKFAVLRVGWIGNGKMEEDSQYRRNYNECKRLGIKVGGYVYSYAESIEAINNGVDFILGIVANDEYELPMYIDLEDNQIAYINKDELTTLALEFCNNIEDNSDLRGGVYANLDWFQNHLDADILSFFDIPLWIAHWNDYPFTYEDSIYHMMQYDVDDSLGIGRVDRDILYYGIDESKDDYIDGTDNINIKGRYQNGSTIEQVYSDTKCQNEIGFLNPYENVPYLRNI